MKIGEWYPESLTEMKERARTDPCCELCEHWAIHWQTGYPLCKHPEWDGIEARGDEAFSGEEAWDIAERDHLNYDELITGVEED